MAKEQGGASEEFKIILQEYVKQSTDSISKLFDKVNENDKRIILNIFRLDGVEKWLAETDKQRAERIKTRAEQEHKLNTLWQEHLENQKTEAERIQRSRTLWDAHVEAEKASREMKSEWFKWLMAILGGIVSLVIGALLAKHFGW